MQLSQEDIQQLIPHRPPFLFLDRIEEVEWGKRAVGVIEDVGAYQDRFRGHFPGYPIMPGALIVEALAEVGAVVGLGLPEHRGKVGLLTGLDNWRFRSPAVPGMRLRLEATLVRTRGSFGVVHAKATCGDELVAEGELSFAIVERPTPLAEPTRL